MEISKVYPITSDSLFSVIKTSFIKSYEEYSGEPLSDDELRSGLEYVVSFGKNHENESKISLNQFRAPYLYEIEVASNRGKTKIRYELEESQDQTKITYKETTEFPDLFSKLNYYLLYPFMKRRFKTKIEENLAFIYEEAKRQKKPEMKNDVI